LNKKVIQTIFEDNDVLVIDKPAGITVHPADGETDTTIAEIFADKYTGDKGSDRDMIVHRLDKGTSGVMVLAKNPSARAFLVNEFKKRKVHKKYLALLTGKLKPEEGIIDMPLARDIVKRQRIAPAEEGKDAKTLYKVVKYYFGHTLIEANPKTGRTHQIRVHFSAIGYPIYGDQRYGNPKEITQRIFLHAAELSFIHPKTGKRVKFISPLPEELEKVLKGLKV
jgi:23S rRNA pseudouridine1911/1915/1917 synthase